MKNLTSLFLVLFSATIFTFFSFHDFQDDSMSFIYSENSRNLVGRANKLPLPTESIINQLKNVNWTYKKIFGIEDIPTTGLEPLGTQLGIVTIYSPSVVKYNGKYVMMFGAGVIPCGPGSQDAIGLAESSDGLNWTFKKFILRPDHKACETSSTQWPTGIIHQVNDPSLFVQDSATSGEKNLWVLYTAAEWHPEIPNGDSCGNIGIASFDKNYNLLFRNDKYLNGLSACDANHTGYSRPDLQWISLGETRLWFDVFSKVFQSTPVTRLDQLPESSPIRTEQMDTVGTADLNTPKLMYDEMQVVVLQNGFGGSAETYFGIQGRSRDKNSLWDAQFIPITRLSGQDWDSWFHGTPSFFLDESSCKPLLYFAGTKRSAYWYPVGSIAVAIPPTGKTFNFPLCNNFPPDNQIPSVSITKPLNKAVIKKGISTIIKATASDNIGVTHVEFLADTELLCTVSAPPYKCTWTPKVAKAYKLKAKAFDAAGNMMKTTVSVIVR